MLLIKLLWPFFWEVFLGKQTMAEAIKTNKKKVFVFLFVIASVFFNVWSFSRLTALGKAYLELERKCIPIEEHAPQHEAGRAAPQKKLDPPTGQVVDYDKLTDEAAKADLINRLKNGG